MENEGRRLGRRSRLKQCVCFGHYEVLNAGPMEFDGGGGGGGGGEGKEDNNEEKK